MNWHDDRWICASWVLCQVLELVHSQSVNSSQNIFGSVSACACDLIVGACDTSCCCDQTCSAAELLTFYCTTGSLSTTSQDVCLTGADVFRTSLQTCTCPDASLLCVVTNNDPSSVMYGDAVPATTPSQFSQELLLHSAPREVWPISPSLFQYGSTSFYHVGEPMLQDVDGVVQFMSLPSPLNSLLCHDSNPITYLSPEDLGCTRIVSAPSVQCAADTPLDASTFLYPGINVLQYPVNLSTSDSSLPPTVVLNVSNTTELQAPSYDGRVCRNVLTKAQFTFLHNGTGVILGASATLTLGDVVVANGTQQTPLTQRFVVSFVKVSGTEVPAVQRSGNPGYVEGAPVLAGNCSSSTVALSVDNGAWLTVLDSGSSCSGRVSVRFLEDRVTSCQYYVSTESLYKCGTNLTSLMAPLVSCVGRYGNSSPLDVSQWIPILNNTNTGGPCDVVTSLHLQILFAYTGSFVSPQAVVVGAQVTYSTTDVFSLCRGSKCNDLSTVLSLRTAVTFVDVSSPPSAVLKSTTNIVRYLPYDFLYPFFASGGHAVVFSLPTLLIQLLSVMVFHLF
ncbi:hypothetical protein EMCRGX_G018205 [Ephydatia muelleri]|eukprot:Em0012g620a